MRGPSFDGTSMGGYCADTTVVCIIVLIAEELVHAFMRKGRTIALSADRAAKARPAAAKAAARAAGA